MADPSLGLKRQTVAFVRQRFNVVRVDSKGKHQPCTVFLSSTELLLHNLSKSSKKRLGRVRRLMSFFAHIVWPQRFLLLSELKRAILLRTSIAASSPSRRAPSKSAFQSRDVSLDLPIHSLCRPLDFLFVTQEDRDAFTSIIQRGNASLSVKVCAPWAPFPLP